MHEGGALLLQQREGWVKAGAGAASSPLPAVYSAGAGNAGSTSRTQRRHGLLERTTSNLHLSAQKPGDAAFLPTNRRRPTLHTTNTPSAGHAPKSWDQSESVSTSIILLV